MIQGTVVYWIKTHKSGQDWIHRDRRIYEKQYCLCQILWKVNKIWPKSRETLLLVNLATFGEKLATISAIFEQKFEILRKANPALIIKKYFQYIYQFKESIMSKDEAFFKD